MGREERVFPTHFSHQASDGGSVMSPRSKITGSLVAVAAIATAAHVAAYDLKPIVFQLAPSGPGSSQAMMITNSHEVPIAIEVRAYGRKQLADGEDVLTPEDDDIVIYPPQMVIQPKTSQSFKVQWVGDPAPKQELAYRIVTNQLPIKFKRAESNGRVADVTMKYRYEAALYVVPKGATPSASLTSVTRVTEAGGGASLELRIRSDGTLRAILDQPSLQLTTATGRSVTLTGDQIKPLVGLNILPGVERVVRIPAPADIEAGPLQGQLQTKYTTL